MHQSFTPGSATEVMSWLTRSALTELGFCLTDMRALEEIAGVNGSTSMAAIARQTSRRLAAIRAELEALNADPEAGEFAALTEAGCAALHEADAA